MSTTEIFLIAMTLIFTLPYLIWRVGRTEYYAPLVVVQIITGILLGPGILGAVYPDYYTFVFTPQVVQLLNGIAWWGVMSSSGSQVSNWICAKHGSTAERAWSPPAWHSAHRCCSAASPQPEC